MTNPNANKRTKAQKEKDRTDIAGHYVKGRTIREISKWIGENRPYTLSRHQVCEDLKAIRKDWRDRTIQAMDEWMDLQLAKFNRIEAEAWDAWDRSKQDRVTTRQFTDAGGQTSESVENAGQTGNVAYLSAILTVIERRCKLLGLDAPERRELSGPAGGPMKILPTVSDEHIDMLLREHYGGHRQG